MQDDSNREIASLIDHTILKANASVEDIGRYCTEGLEFGFCSVVVNPIHVSRASQMLKGSEVGTTCVVGFPLGAELTAVKLKQTEMALHQGADEIDVVIDLGAYVDGRYRDIETELAAIRRASKGRILKVIIEASLLSDDGKIATSSMAAAAGADFVKTSTGFSNGGATVHDVALIRKTVGPDIGVKASGGIRTRADAMQMLDAGANRIGTSVGPLLLRR
ncbi:deoxyribose-phosphate aldolase [Ensifer adhaerens]|uniref:deoxyribose-phosphate aldolase n=1 Tax=Ensifer canadensis TaxID=555315 RepID=UPI00148F6C63|nr:deoxyribose-phosphate aldolase [Ensifer canadensis]NOV20223.1 deoxyribose-phosphate aldolase [Ensifer canadensis]